MVTGASTVFAREWFRLLRDSRDRSVPGAECRSCSLDHLPYLADAREVADAADLIRMFGEGAGFEAAARADRSRDIGNHLHFCKWRQIERLVVLMSIPRAVGTIH
jgi:hypothetical protein